MARTQAADYEQRREEIMERAACLFAKSGFHGASVAELAVACEVSKSLLYHYYESKEAILYEVMASHIECLCEDVAFVMALDDSAEGRLRKLVHLFMRHYVGASYRQKVVINEIGNLPAEKRELIIAKQRGLVDAVQILLTALHPDLASDPKRARARTMLMFGMINWTHTWFDPKGPLSADDIADMALDLIGIGSTNPPSSGLRKR